MRIRPAVVIIENNKLLLLKYKYGNSYVYGIPGGSVETGETLKETLVRELREELSVDICVNDLIFIAEIIFQNSKESILNCIFSGKIIGGSPIINKSETKALEYSWCELFTLKHLNLYPDIGSNICDWAYSNQEITTKYLGKIEQNWFN